jgi:hypothetical protein
MARPGPAERPDHAREELPPALAEYADRLLLGTGLDAADALRIAAGQLDPPTELHGLVMALRAGWRLSEDPA